MDTVSGLDDATFYDVYVRSLCSINETSDWSIQNVFVTPILNDNFEDAVAVACGDNYTGNTGFATPDGDFSSPNVWFSFTGSGVAEIVTLSLCDSDFGFDTVIRLYTGTSGDLTQVAQNDEGSCGLQSQLTFSSDGSTTYYISVEGSFSSEVGNYDLDVTCVDAPTCNAPENLSIANITLSGADLSWDAEATADDGYQWVVMPSGVLPVLDGSTEVAADTTDSSTTQDSVTGLSSGTSYDAYVRSLCSTSETSDWSEVANFTLIQSQIIYIVNTTDDTADADLSDTSCEDINGNCSLRAAIQNANKTSNKDSIEFNLSGTSPFVFEITTDVLPPIQEPVILDGRTQAGYTDSPLIEIDGTLLGPGNNGIQFTGNADASEMYGLAIGGFQRQDVDPFDLGQVFCIFFVDDIILQGNYIGLRSDGTTVFTNEGGGVRFISSNNSLIGGTNPKWEYHFGKFCRWITFKQAAIIWCKAI